MAPVEGGGGGEGCTASGAVLDRRAAQRRRHEDAGVAGERAMRATGVGGAARAGADAQTRGVDQGFDAGGHGAARHGGSARKVRMVSCGPSEAWLGNTCPGEPCSTMRKAMLPGASVSVEVQLALMSP